MVHISARIRLHNILLPLARSLSCEITCCKYLNVISARKARIRWNAGKEREEESDVTSGDVEDLDKSTTHR